MTSHTGRMLYCLRKFSADGKALKDICGPRCMGRKPDTLKRYCRAFGICFSDYTPRHMTKKRKGARCAL